MSGTPDATTPAVTEEDRAKAAEVLRYGTADARSLSSEDARRVTWVAAALAAERGKADALRAAMHTLAEELEGETSGVLSSSLRHFYREHAARLRAIADGQR